MLESTHLHVDKKSHKTNIDKTSTTKHKKCDGQSDAEEKYYTLHEKGIP